MVLGEQGAACMEAAQASDCVPPRSDQPVALERDRSDCLEGYHRTCAAHPEVDSAAPYGGIIVQQRGIDDGRISRSVSGDTAS